MKFGPKKIFVYGKVSRRGTIHSVVEIGNLDSDVPRNPIVILQVGNFRLSHDTFTSLRLKSSMFGFPECQN